MNLHEYYNSQKCRNASQNEAKSPPFSDQIRDERGEDYAHYPWKIGKKFGPRPIVDANDFKS